MLTNWFRQLLNNAPGALVLLKAIRTPKGVIEDFEYIFRNEKTLDIYNKEFPANDFLPTKETPLYDACVHVIESGETWSGEIKHRLNGADFLLHTNIDKWNDGCVISYAATNDPQKKQDIKPLQKNDPATKLINRYEALLDSIEQSVCIVKVLFDKENNPYDYLFLETNPAFEIHTGLANATGKTAKELVPALEQYWFEVYGQVARTGIPAHFERKAGGLERWYEVHAFRVDDPAEDHICIVFSDISARKLAEESLDKKQAQLAAMFEALPVAVAFINAEGKYLFMNQRMEHFIPDHIMPSQQKVQRWFATYPDGSPVESHNFPGARALRGEHIVPGIEMLYQPEKGTPVWTRVAAVPVKNNEGKTIGLATVVTDVSELKLITEQQAYSLRLSDALRSLNDHDTIKGTAMQLLGRQINAAHAQYWQADSMDGYFISTGAFAQDGPAFEGRILLSDFGEYLSSAFHAGQTVSIADIRTDKHINIHERKAYTAMGFRAFIAVPLLKDGKLVGGIAIQHTQPREWTEQDLAIIQITAERTWDAVERSKAEQELKLAEEKYMITLEQEVKQRTDEIKEQSHFITQVTNVLPDLLGVIDIPSRIINYINDEITHVLGFTKEEFMGMTVAERSALVHPDYHQAVARHFEKFTTLGDNEEIEIEYQAKNKKGEWRWFCARGKVFRRNEAGVVTQSVNVVQDITNRKKIEQEVHELNKVLLEKNRELAYVNSEIKTFNTIATTRYTELLKNVYLHLEHLVSTDSKKLSDSSRANIRRAQSSVQKLSLLTEDLVRFTKLKNLDMQSEQVNLYTILTHVINDFASQKEDFTIVNHCPPVLVISGYPFLLSLVFHHLLDNAIKFRKGDKVHIELAYEKDAGGLHHVISVTDNGLGFPAEEAENIFTIFYQLQEKGKYRGSGIGLAICKKIMELHGGHITAHGEPGEGAGFRCYFPVG